MKALERQEEETGRQSQPASVLFFIAISPTKMGGLELFARYLALALERRGSDIVFCFSTPPSEAVRSLLDRPNTRLMHLRQQAGFSSFAARELWELVRLVRPATVVYSFGGILRSLPWICWLAGVRRVIYNDHASRVPGDCSGSSIKRFAARLLTHPVSSVIAVSEFVAASSRRERLHNAPVAVVPNGIELGRREHAATRQEFLASHGIPPERRVVSQLSWLVKEKGVDIFLRAAAEILRHRNDVHFVVGGEGAGRAGYEQLTRELGISGNVTFLGQLSDPVASGFYPASDIFCLASRWHEACGLVLLEAMSFGVPVVASRVGGIPEFVRDGVDGLLAGGDAAAFAAAIATLLQDEERRRRMGISARQRVEEAFDVRLMAERYADLLAGPAADGAPEGSFSGRDTSRAVR
jgi:glycosyltransferase involved in cell wall biosynthesis